MPPGVFSRNFRLTNSEAAVRKLQFVNDTNNFHEAKENNRFVAVSSTAPHLSLSEDVFAGTFLVSLLQH